MARDPGDTVRMATQRGAQPIEVTGVQVHPGSRVDLSLKLSEFYLGAPVETPLYVLHGARPGPRVFVTAAIHGDEVNGVEAARRLLRVVKPRKLAGTLLVLPVANMPAFLSQKRTLPDGRDLNRIFPGTESGSQASRVAHALWTQVVKHCDYGIDLHTAGRFRTNAPHVRGDLSNPEVKRLARAFGTELVLERVGEKGSLRAEATKAGIPVLLFEGGEVMRFQAPVIRVAVRGVLNVLSELGMVDRKRTRPRFRVIAKSSSWGRPGVGGLLELRVKPGQLVKEGTALALVRPPFGRAREVLRAPWSGMVIGTSLRPMVAPGDAVVHLVRLDRTFAFARRGQSEEELEVA